MELPFESLEVFLAWIVSGAGGIALAHILDQMGWFRSMVSNAKFLFVLALSIILPVVGIYLKHILYAEMIDLDTLFISIQSAIVLFASSQYAYSKQVVPKNTAKVE